MTSETVFALNDQGMSALEVWGINGHWLVREQNNELKYQFVAFVESMFADVYRIIINLFFKC